MADAPIFLPTPRTKAVIKHVQLDFSVEEYDQIKNAARLHGLAIDKLCHQAVLFALRHLGPPPESAPPETTALPYEPMPERPSDE